MDYNQHVILFNNLLVYFDSIISALYHSCSQTRFSQDCHAVEDRLKHNLSKFSSLQASINCTAYISGQGCDSSYNIYHQQPTYPSYIPATYGSYSQASFTQTPLNLIYNNNNSEQDEEYSSQDTESSSTEVDALKNDDNSARVASFVTVTSPNEDSSRSSSPDLKNNLNVQSNKESNILQKNKSTEIVNNCPKTKISEEKTIYNEKTFKPEVIIQKPKPIIDNEGFILVNRRIQKARERRERILQKRREVFQNSKQKTEIIKTESQAHKENLGQTIEERQKRAEINRNEIQLQKIRKAQAEDDKIKINSLVASIDAQSKKGSLYLKDASSNRRIEEFRARKWQHFALRDALFNARREYCETKELQRREQIKSQSQMKLAKAEEARREKIESTLKKEQTWAEKTNAIKKRKEKENEDLKKKIEEKISQQQKRYEENLEQKRQKAFELSVRSSLLVNSENALLCESYNPVKICKLCCVKIKSEVYLFGHMQSRLHCDMFDKHVKSLKNILTLEENDSLNMSFIVDVDGLDSGMECKEDFGRRNIRFIKKLKGFINSEIHKYEQGTLQGLVESSNEKIRTLVSRIDEAIKKESIKVLSTRIELLHKELIKNPSSADKQTFKCLVLSLKSLNNRAEFEKCYQAIMFHLEGSEIFKKMLAHSGLCLILVELLDLKLFTLDDGLEEVCHLITEILRDDDKKFVENVTNYLFAIGIFEKICSYIKHYRFENSTQLLIAIIELVESLSLIAFSSCPILTNSVNAIKNTQFNGLVSLMYEMVFRTGSSIRNEEIAEKFDDKKLTIVVRIFQMFNQFPIDIVQNVLGQEGISLQIRHLCSFLIWIMKSPQNDSKIDVIFKFILNFTIYNSDNQTLLRCGASPTVLEQLVQLDISYFISKNHNTMIIPALIGLCYENYDNFVIMTNDLSPVFVLEYIDKYFLSSNSSISHHFVPINPCEFCKIRNFFSLQPS